MQLLIQAGANLEAHDCHLGTALHVACYGQHHDCAKVLLDAGNVHGQYLFRSNGRILYSEYAIAA